LLGSSAGSRGQALMENGLATIPKSQDTKPSIVDLQPPRAGYSFSSPKISSSQLRSSSTYSTWTAPSATSMAQMASSAAAPYPTPALDPYPKVPITGGSAYSAEPQELPLPTTLAPPVQLSLTSTDHSQSSVRSPYSYNVQGTSAPPQIPATATTMGPSESALSVPRYVDSNPRPTKSPRHIGHQSVHGSESVSAGETSPDYRYNSYGAVNTTSGEAPHTSYSHEVSTSGPPPPRDYYSTAPASSWTTTAGEHAASTAYASADGRSYSFSHDQQYKNGAPSIPPVKTESSPAAHPPVYGGGHRGSFDGMNNYSWSGSTGV
jgi:hypothetical protein